MTERVKTVFKEYISENFPKTQRSPLVQENLYMTEQQFNFSPDLVLVLAVVGQVECTENQRRLFKLKDLFRGKCPSFNDIVDILHCNFS